MKNAEEVISEMLATGNFKKENLSYITDEFLENASKQAKDLSEGPVFISGVWTGNHFYISGGVWHWQDQPGSQCGTSRTWSWTPRPGNSYSAVGSCPQGYPWYQMTI